MSKFISCVSDTAASTGDVDIASAAMRHIIKVIFFIRLLFFLIVELSVVWRRPFSGCLGPFAVQPCSVQAVRSPSVSQQSVLQFAFAVAPPSLSILAPCDAL